MNDLFRDRREAGERLGQALARRGYRGPGLLVLGIPRGGVPVAEEVARALHAPLDVVISRKLRAPDQPELAIGAVVSSDSVLMVSEELAHAAGASPEYLEREVRHQRQEIARRMRDYRGDRPPPEIQGRTVIVVDDGIATGYTFGAALAGLRQQRPGRLIAAIPVAPPESLAAVAAVANDVVCLATPDPFWAVGMWYADFSPTTDDEVIAILKRHAAPDEEGRSTTQQGRPTMTQPKCHRHDVAMQLIPVEPYLRCMNCGYTISHHLQFETCRECGSRMHIVEPEPRWQCPVCHPVPAGATQVG